MARLARVELFDPREIAIVHVISRVVRRIFLLGTDPATGENYDHRKQWIEDRLQELAASFGVDLLAYSILSNHMHLVLRSRPDVVSQWDDTEVARRWLTICPGGRKSKTPTEAQLNSIRTDTTKLAEIRLRLSDISWWMRLLNQPIAARANKADNHVGHFWQDRFRAVRLLDESAVLACAAYVDLNPIRAALAETIEDSPYTSAARRCASLEQSEAAGATKPSNDSSSDAMLAPTHADEANDLPGPLLSKLPTRASDKGFLPFGDKDYIELLDWTARHVVPGKNPAGATPTDFPSVLERLKLSAEAWSLLVTNFGRMFSHVAGQVHRIDDHRGMARGSRFHVPEETRRVLSG